LLVSKRTGERIVISREEFKGKDKVYLERLENCQVFLPFKMKAFYCKHIKNCQIYAGFIEGGSLIEVIEDSIFHF